ncbi:MAG: energy-coupling factor ABC transporter permease [Anaerolineales bacterium]|nr:energy-coupling factor ABC transporter permease [Anaerolineales bacterium]
MPVNGITDKLLLMHIPDGFLSLLISIFSWVVTAIMLAVAVRQARETFNEQLAPLAGVMAAFIFAGQMINFPVAGGTSGHLIGATLAYVVLGPWLGMLAMTAVIVLQALLFQDGGLVVMGANILVMGIVPGMVGYGIYQLAKGKSRRLQTGLIGLGAWLSVVIAALVTAVLLGFSGTTSFALAIPAMVGIHMLIGLGEALITVAALSFIARLRPGLLQGEQPVKGTGWVLGGLLIALVVTLFSPLASAFPDGLEWVAEQQGFIETAQGAPIEVLPDYTLPFLGETGLSTILAGVVGVLLVAGLTAVMVRLLRRPSTISHSGD